jgi:hypothetical protein
MSFAQLTYRESLRDIETCLKAIGGKIYHTGIRRHVPKSTLADANEKRDWRIFSDFAHVLIAQAVELYAGEPFGADLAVLPMPWTPPPSICASLCSRGRSSAKRKQR